jgi:hypothetical protein
VKLRRYLIGSVNGRPSPGFTSGRRMPDLSADAVQGNRKSAVQLRVPKLFNLRTDLYERADTTSNTYYDWMMDHIFLFVPAQKLVGDFLATFLEFPPRQKAASFSIDHVLEKMANAATAQR